jgi:hypothetical protein
MGRPDITEPGHGVSNIILYRVMFEKELNDDLAASVAKRAVEQPDAHLTTEQMYAGIIDALHSDAVLTEAFDRHQQGEQDYRDFLARVARHLDAMRPWPQRPFQTVDPLSWYDLDYARLIARVKLSIIGVERRLQQVFGRAGDGSQVMALRLKSGAEVALVAQYWAGSKDVAVLQRDPRLQPADVLAEFCGATGITPDEIAVEQ